jgi:serine/threonine-protein kinase
VVTRLGRYDVIRTLAKGALTDLLLGRASGMEGFQRHVVIKRLRQEHAQDPAVLEMFVNEARLAAALLHHNIVQVLDSGDGGGARFCAME